MNIQQSTPMTPLRARMIADMSGRNLGPASQTSHLRACKRFAAWLGRSPETATPDDVKYFQQHLVESGVSICMYSVNHLVRQRQPLWPVYEPLWCCLFSGILVCNLLWLNLYRCCRWRAFVGLLVVAGRAPAETLCIHL